MRDYDKKVLRDTWIQFIRDIKKERSETCEEPLEDEFRANEFSSILPKERGYENDKKN